MKDECQQSAIDTQPPASPSTWRVVGASVCGTSHQKRSQPCQDDHFWHCRHDGVLIAAVADGAGSASLGEVGAQIAVRTAVERLRAVDFREIPIELSAMADFSPDGMPEDAVSTESLTASSENRSEDTAEIDRADDIPSESQDGQKEGSDGESGNELKKERISLPPLGKTELPESNPVDILTGVVKSDPPDSAGSNSPIRLLLADALESARQAVEAAAEERHVAVRELASTLIAIVATPDWVAAAQVGDGAAVVCDVENQILPLTIPKSGEYINETTFLISPNARASAQFHLWQGTPMQIAMFSDGLQLLALDMPAGTPHAPFFAPLFRFVAQDNLSDDRAKEELENFLTSDRVTQRADDDLTLVLATFNGSGRERGTGNGEREED